MRRRINRWFLVRGKELGAKKSKKAAHENPASCSVKDPLFRTLQSGLELPKQKKMPPPKGWGHFPIKA